MRKGFTLVSISIAVGVIVFFWISERPKERADKIVIISGAVPEKDSLLASQIELQKVVDSIKPMTEEVVRLLKEQEALRDNYQEKLTSYEAVGYDVQTIGYGHKDRDTTSSVIAELRKKLNDANNEISRLKNELAAAKKPYKEYNVVDTDMIRVPDENSIIINVDGKSKKGDLSTSGLTIYLIPYGRKAKRYMQYETSCDTDLGGSVAEYYNGLYFFNGVKAGKYLIKICTYYGNYKVINKNEGKYSLSMKLSPPLQ